MQRYLVQDIFVSDATGNLVGRAVKRFDRELPPALYKVRYQIGDRVVDQLVELPSGEGEYHPETPELPINSAAALRRANSDWSWARFAEHQSRIVQLTCGSGSFLFLFVIADPYPDIPVRPAAGLTLHRFSGDIVADFADAQTDAGCGGYSLEVDPGNYMLRAIVDSGSPVEQTVVVVKGWQTQIYIRLARAPNELLMSCRRRGPWTPVSRLKSGSSISPKWGSCWCAAIRSRCLAMRNCAGPRQPGSR